MSADDFISKKFLDAMGRLLIVIAGICGGVVALAVTANLVVWLSGYQEESVNRKADRVLEDVQFEVRMSELPFEARHQVDDLIAAQRKGLRT